ncbi:MAG: Lsr2 family protein [Actinomycetales bacterium]
MAKQTILVDDIDGGEADETVVFALDGVSYEIDLNSENAGRLRDELAEWVSHARNVRSGSSRGRAAKSPAARKSADNATIRSWAQEEGFNVKDRGRIPAEVVEAYHAAH